jgi:HlyD family secretion protein
MMKKSHILLWVVPGIALSVAACDERLEGHVSDTATVLQEVHAVGYVEPMGRVRRLSFETQGVIDEISFGIGDRVKAGDIIARLKDEDQQARVRLAERRVAVARAELALLEAGAHPDDIAAAHAAREAAASEYQYRKAEAERYLQLADGRSVAESDLAEARYLKEMAVAEEKRSSASLEKLKNQTRAEDMEVARSRVAEAEHVLEMEKKLLAQRSIRAQMDGMILERFKEPGEAYTNLMPEAVVLFAPDGPMEVRAEVDETLWGTFQEGAATVITSPDGVVADGTVRLIKRAMGRKTVFSRIATEKMDLKVFEVWIEMKNDPGWPVGMEVDVRIPAK